MPRKDVFHETVITALEKDGWKVTNDPLFVPTEGGVNFFIDLGLEGVIGAEKAGKQIAVEVKSFDQNSPIHSFYEILGQYLIYELALQEQIKPWEIYISISELGFKKLDEAPIFLKAIKNYRLKFILFDPLSKSIVKWKE